MKKNVFLRIALLLLVAMLATTGVFIGTGTTAKYVAEAEVSASATVAKFDVKVQVNGGTMSGNIAEAGENEISVTGVGSLLKPDTATAHGTTTISDDSGAIIAPGTQGKLSLVIQNDSQVMVNVKIDASVTPTEPTGAGIVYCNTANGTFGGFAAAVEAAVGTNGVNIAPNASTTNPIEIYWQWPFEENDTQDGKDTALGVDATESLVFDPLTIDVEQVD